MHVELLITVHLLEPTQQIPQPHYVRSLTAFAQPAAFSTGSFFLFQTRRRISYCLKCSHSQKNTCTNPLNKSIWQIYYFAPSFKPTPASLFEREALLPCLHPFYLYSKMNSTFSTCSFYIRSNNQEDPRTEKSIFDLVQAFFLNQVTFFSEVI